MSTISDFREEVPEEFTGAWHIDPTHSQITFTIRHAVVAVRCAFADFSGTITVGKIPEESVVNAEIRTASFTSGFEHRDKGVRFSHDLLAGETFPTITFASAFITSISGSDHYRMSGDLTVLGVTRRVDLDVEFLGVGHTEMYGTRAGFLATTRLDRRNFGMTRDTPYVTSDRDLGDGNRLLGWTLDVEINIEAVLPSDPGKYGLERISG